MRFLSVCSGIEAASVAWNPLCWHAAALSEIEPFPCAVLAHHYPAVPNHGDMTRFAEWPDHAIDLLCGGTPCQSFSVAGLRKGLDDPRGNLMLTFGAIAARYRPRWLVWENVPGVLSSNGGRDFGAFLGLLGILGYGFAYRVLDAQYFGLAQRRKRVFVVGCLGDWRRAAAVLFERHSLQGHPAPSREARAGAAVGALAGTSSGGGWRVGADEAAAGQLVPSASMCLNAKGGAGRLDAESETLIPTIGGGFDVAHALTGEGFDASEDGTGRGTPLVPVAHAFDARQSDVIQSGDKTGPLDTDGQTIGVLAFSCKDHGADASDDLAPTLRAMAHSSSHANAGGQMAVARTLTNGGRGSRQDKQPMTVTGASVRRLTPRECERLQGFPDDYTLIPYRGKPAADGPRYKALGNSWAMPCVRWIGRRINAVEAIAQMEAA